MNKFELLKQLMSQSGNSEKQKDYMEDQYNLPLDQRIQDIKGMARNPELYKSLPVTEYEEPASNDIWYAPDELVAGAVAPGVQKAIQKGVPASFKVLKSMAQSSPGILANEVGAIGPKINPNFKPKWITAADKEVKKTTNNIRGSKLIPSNNPESPLEGLTREQYEQHVSDNLRRLNERSIPEQSPIDAQNNDEYREYILNKIKEAKEAKERAAVIPPSTTKRVQPQTKLSSDANLNIIPKLTQNKRYDLGAVVDTMQNSLKRGDEWETMLKKLPEMTTKQYNEILSQRDNYLQRLKKNFPKKK